MKIFLIGFMGSGKTHWGRLLSEKLKLPFFDLDSVISTTEQKTISAIFAENGEEFFRYKEKEVMQEIVNDHDKFTLSCGGGTPCFFNNIEFMKKHGTVIWLNTSINVLKNRLLNERVTRSADQNNRGCRIKKLYRKKTWERRMYYEQADLIINEESASLNSIIESLKS